MGKTGVNDGILNCKVRQLLKFQDKFGNLMAFTLSYLFTFLIKKDKLIPSNVKFQKL